MSTEAESDRAVLNDLRIKVNRYESAFKEIISVQEHSDDCACGIKDAICIPCIAETALKGDAQ